MMRSLHATCLSLALFFCTLLHVGGAQADVMPLPGGPKLSDCSKARDPARCEARIKARRACSDKRGDSKRACMDAYVVSPDCARADQPKRCAAQKQAEQSCRGKHGKAYKSCVQTALKKNLKPTKTASKPQPGTAAPITPSDKQRGDAAG